MANAMTDAFRDFFLGGDNDWDSDHRTFLVDGADYTPNMSTHNFLDDIASGARVGTATAIANRTHSAGVADGDDTTLTSVSGDPSEYIAIYQHTGTESTSDYGVLFDTATGLPVTPNGANITITWDSGANKIFKL